MIRLIDSALALVALVCASPLLLLSAVGIKVSSAGPVIYRARRAGLHGEPFTMYKLRTMHVGREAESRITSGADPRVFGLGRLLRQTKIDELPQLANVLRGEMALVGPRPEDPSIVRDHYDAMMWESLEVPPGLTGPGALDYFADESALPTDPVSAEAVYLAKLLPHKIALDLVYVRRRTVGYHLQLLTRTALGVVGVRKIFDPLARQELSQAAEILSEASRHG